MHSKHGVTGFDDMKFWLALLCYLLTLPLLMQGAFTWDNFYVIMPCAIAFIVVTTLAWDYRIIGNPNRIPCLVLHFFFFVSLVFLLNRLMTLSNVQPGAVGAGLLNAILPANLGGTIVGSVQSVLSSLPLVGAILNGLKFATSWLGFALILFFVSGAIIFPPRTAVPLLFIFGFVVVIVSVARHFDSGLWTLFAALVLLAAAFHLQQADEGKGRFWNVVAEKFAHAEPRPAMDMKIKIALLRELHERRTLGITQFRGIIASKLDRDTGDPLLNPVCNHIADQLIYHDHLAENRGGRQDWRCELTVPDEEPDFFTSTARTVRVVVTLAFCVIYILSPLDIIPDATPVFGVVDDMALGVVGGLSAMRTIWPDARIRRREGNRLPF